MTPFDELLSGVYSTTITEASILVRELRVRVGVLTKPVTVRIFYDGKRAEPFSYEISEVLKTPGREATDGPRTAATENDALRRAVRTLTEAYEDAVRQGQLPEDAWLVESDVRR